MWTKRRWPAEIASWLCGVLLVCVSTAQADSSLLFSDDAVLDVRLAGRFSMLFADPQSDQYLPFRIEAEGISHDIQVRLRGNSRRRVCDFPPLRLDFSTASITATIFDGQDKLKLVTHCLNHDRGEQDLLEEYLAYRILNVLSPFSYRVRLLRLEYVDVDERLPEKATPRYGFLIEHIDEFEERTGAREVTLNGVPKRRHDIDHAAMIYVFEYMIGNTDWQLTRPDDSEGCCHNIDLVEKGGIIMLLPYDFDLSGIVNAKYAYPDPKLRIKRVTQRLYRGVCTDADTLRRAVQTVHGKRDRILGMVAEIPGLTDRSIRRSRAYLEAFFERAASPEKLLHSFERNCV